MAPVRLRLARFGVRHAPFYRIHVADSRSPRDGKHVEVVGTYDPVPGTSCASFHAHFHVLCISVCSPHAMDTERERDVMMTTSG